MHAISFIQDLAVIMLVAGVVTILFHRFKQPVVLGYIVAGFIIGPHTPPFGLIHDEETIKTLAELGVIFLMFCLGLEFSLRKLFKVGATAFIAAFMEITLMIWIGYEIGRWFDWNTMDSLFLGAILAISSTTIIVKALNDLKMKNERFAQLIFGVLIVEDILGIGIIALLSSIAVSGSVSPEEVFSTVGKLSLFMIVALVIGILLVPRVLAYVARFESNEMLLITVLGLCFGFCLLVVKLEYSMVLGAFLIGAIMAESRQLLKIERLIEPVRDLFSAIFFVAIGLMLDPAILLEYALPIVVITIAVVLGKMLSCGLGAFIAGNDGRTSLRVGMGLSQIGEFSFIIAALEGLRGTFFRQAMFAEFEAAIHAKVDKGEALTGEQMTAIYADILKRYHGEAQGVMKIDPAYALEWAYVPHFYHGFYVFQYATSIAAAQDFAQRILAKEPGALQAYLKMLASGGSAYPYELVKAAGVDLATPKPYQALVARMNSIMDRIEAIESKRGK